MKKLLLILLLSISQIAFANTNTADSFSSTFKLLDGKKPIYIEFTDIIQERYKVDVEWLPIWDEVPRYNGAAKINFELVDRDVKFTIYADLFHIGPQFIKVENIESKEPIKVQFSNLTINPFDFRDVNFDGTDELVIRNSNGGQRGYDSYSVYLIQELEDTSYFNVLDLRNVMPYRKFDETTIFDWDNGRVEMYYSGGACSSEEETYERVYSQYPLQDYRFKLIEKKRWDYMDKDRNRIPCTKYVYNVIDGKEILDETRSGPVD